MKETPLIFIGDTHGFIDDFKKQKEIILKLKPEYVLCESIQNQKFITHKDYKTNQKFQSLNKLIGLCYKKKIKLIGIDIKNFGLKKYTKSGKIKINKKTLNNIINRRNRHHIKIIKKYRQKSTKPIIIIVGAYHLRNKSSLVSKIKNAKLIIPCDKNKKPIYKPIKGKITYLTRQL